MSSILEDDLKNRRRANRINRALQVTALDHQKRRLLSVALNVSATGARLVLTRPCPESFTVEFDAHTRVLARPVWKRALQRSQVVGVQFDFRSEAERRQVFAFLQRLAA